MRTVSLVLASVLYWAGVMAQTTNNPLNNFISQVASLATQFQTSTTSSSQTSSTSSPTSSQTSRSSTTSSSSAASSSASSTSTSDAAASTSAASPTAAAASGGGGLSPRTKGIIAGSVVGGVLVLALLCALLCCCLLRQRRRRRKEKKDWEKRGLHDSDEAIHKRREVWDTAEPKSPHHGIFGTSRGSPRHSYGALPRQSGGSDHGMTAGTLLNHRDRHSSSNSGLGTHVGVVGGAKESPKHSSSALPRHSGAADRNFFSGTRHDHHNRHKSGGSSGPLLQDGDHLALRNSNGSNLSGGMVDPSSPTSINSGIKRRPVPGDDHHHYASAALGAGAVGAVAGATAHKHHNEKRRSSGIAPGDYVEDNHRYSSGSASNSIHRRSGEHPPLPTQNDQSRIPPLPGQTNTNGPPPASDSNRPATPFGLAALGSHSPHRSPHGSPPVYPDEPFTATRRSGSFPDPSVTDHSQQYPEHHVSSEPRRPSHGSSGPPLVTGSMAAGGGTDASRHTGSFPGPNMEDIVADYPYQHTAAPPTASQRRSLQEREMIPGGDSSEYVAYAPQNGRGQRYSLPDERDRSQSNSASRVPPAAVGAIGRDSPRVTAQSSGSSEEENSRLPRPAYPGQQTYASYSSEAPTPGDEIPGAFPREDGRPIGHGMRENRHSYGEGSPARSGRKLRFSNRHEQWEFGTEDRPQETGVGRAL